MIHWDEGHTWIRVNAGVLDGSWSTANYPMHVKRISGAQLTLSSGKLEPAPDHNPGQPGFADFGL
jgi:hypothetical protein